MRENDLNAWKVPTWHTDFGDSAAEFRLLQQFSKEIVRSMPTLSASFVTPEPGYMYVEFYMGPRKIAELYVVDIDGSPKYGIFGFVDNADSDERYFSDIAEGVAILTDHARLCSEERTP